MSDRLFDLEEIPEVPIFREPRARKGAAAGSSLDARFLNDYPPEWSRCPTCEGRGMLPGTAVPEADRAKLGKVLVHIRAYEGQVGWLGWFSPVMHARHFEILLLDKRCTDCLGMGSVKARVRLESGHRCLRCKHPYMPKGDAKMLGVECSFLPGGWSACDERCEHEGPVRVMRGEKLLGEFREDNGGLEVARIAWPDEVIEAEWRILTVHHADGDKANLRWWNLLSLCQRCHLEVQAKVVMDRVWPHPHSEWFQPFVAGYYAHVYLCKVCGKNLQYNVVMPHAGEHDDYPHMCSPGLELTREQVMERLPELLALELDPAYLQ